MLLVVVLMAIVDVTYMLGICALIGLCNVAQRRDFLALLVLTGILCFTICHTTLVLVLSRPCLLSCVCAMMCVCVCVCVCASGLHLCMNSIDVLCIPIGRYIQMYCCTFELATQGILFSAL